jgi:hypothetical protein
MKISIFAASLLALAIVMDSAYAQQGPQNYTVTVPSQDMVTIMNALSNLPYKDSYGLIARLSQQIQSQNQPEPKSEPPK